MSVMSLMDWLQLLAPFAALWVGVFVYSKQKKIDRRDMLLSECRVVYRDFISAAEVFLESACNSKDEAELDQQTVLYRRAFMALKIYAPQKVVDLAKPLLMEIIELHEVEDSADFTEEAEKVRKRIEAIVSAMRTDCVDPQR